MSSEDRKGHGDEADIDRAPENQDDEPLDDLLELSDIDTRLVRVTLTGLKPLLTHGMDEEAVFKILHRGDRPPPDKTAPARKVAEAGVIYPPKGHPYEGKACVHTEMLFGMMKAAGRGIKVGRVAISTAKSTKLPFLMEVLDDFILIQSDKGWVPDIKRGTGQTGNAVAAIRPRWDDWSITFTMRIVLAYGFTPQLAYQILDNAGAFIGLGGYRPSRNGRFGLFHVTRFDHWDGGKLPRATFTSAVKDLSGPPESWTPPSGLQVGVGR